MQGYIGLTIFAAAWAIVAFVYKTGAVRRNLMGFCAGVIAVVIYIAVIGEAPPLEPQVEKPHATITAPFYSKAYAENEVKADDYFKHASVTISGIAQGVEKSGGDIVVRIEGANAMSSVIAVLKGGSEKVAIEIQPGDAVAFLCVGGGKVSGVPTLLRCQPTKAPLYS